MPKLFRSRVTLVMLSGILASVSVGCSNTSLVSTPNIGTVEVTNVPPANAETIPASPPAPASPSAQAPSQPDDYQRAIAKASSAFTIGQSAQSQDDWRLVASRWQQAIDLMAAVSQSNSNHGQAQTKLREYRRNLAYAQQQLNRPSAPSNTEPVIVVAPPRTQSAASPMGVVSVPQPIRPGNGVFQVPITRRVGGTPVVGVTFNGNQTFEMIVDTGASGTLITRQMAASLGVVPVGQAQVDTASARDVTFPLGYVNSMQVGGAVARNIMVAVAGPELGVGLLGHDFFGNYDVTIRQHDVEFRER